MKIYNLIAKLWEISPESLRSFYYRISGDKTLASIFIPNKYEQVEIQTGISKGKKLRLKLRDERGYFLGSHEWETQKTILKFLNNGMIVYNVGAHIGFYALGMSRLVGPQGKVIAFEPNPQVYTRLYGNISINNVLNVTALPYAVGDFDGVANFSTSLSDTQGRFSHLPYVKNGPVIQVPCIRIDTFIKEGGPVPSFMMIDVEHAEGSVFRGMVETLIQHRPIILVELHGPAAITEAWDILSECEYKLAQIPDLTIVSQHDISYGQYLTAHESFFTDKQCTPPWPKLD
jgi:FkbM family methyltransferase